MNDVATPHVKKRHAHKQKQRRFFFRQSEFVVWLCQHFLKFLPVSVHSLKIARPVMCSRQNTRTQTYTHATCYMPHRWGPAGRPESRLAGASSVSLRESWWEWRRCPPRPPRPRSGSAPPGPRWSLKEPGPKLPVPNLPAPRPQPTGWSRETPHWNKHRSVHLKHVLSNGPFTLTTKQEVIHFQWQLVFWGDKIYLNQSEHKRCLIYSCWFQIKKSLK